MRLGPDADRVLDLVDGGGVAEVDLIERQAAVDEVRVRVVEPGHDRAALGVDDDGLRALEALNFAVRADADDLVAADGDRLREIGAAIGGVDLAVDDDQIDRAIVFALRADDETGDEGHPDDERHDICRETGRHWQILACFSVSALPCQHLRMRFAILGSGAVGGYFGAKLARAGQDVTFIARGAHLEAIRSQGSGDPERQARRFRGAGARRERHGTDRPGRCRDRVGEGVRQRDRVADAEAADRSRHRRADAAERRRQRRRGRGDRRRARTCSAARPTWRRRSRGPG